MNWKLICRLSKGGHRLFQDTNSNRYAIADSSGGNPGTCEDGVLWLDLGAEQTLVLSSSDGGPIWAKVPLFDRNEKAHFTGESAEGAFKLADLFPGCFSVQIELSGKRYNLTPAYEPGTCGAIVCKNGKAVQVTVSDKDG